MLFDKYDVDSGDKPEDVAFKLYGMQITLGYITIK